RYDPFHYSPDLFDLLVDTIPKLCRSKADVLIFFRGAGVPETDFRDLRDQLRRDRSSLSTYMIARTILTRLNQLGDARIEARRELLKRVVEFEDFSTCWENNQKEARGLVAQIREIVNVKDTFTRMAHERDRERSERLADAR